MSIKPGDRVIVEVPSILATGKPTHILRTVTKTSRAGSVWCGHGEPFKFTGALPARQRYRSGLKQSAIVRLATPEDIEKFDAASRARASSNDDPDRELRERAVEALRGLTGYVMTGLGANAAPHGEDVAAMVEAMKWAQTR